MLLLTTIGSGRYLLEYRQGPVAAEDTFVDEFRIKKNHPRIPNKPSGVADAETASNNAMECCCHGAADEIRNQCGGTP